VTARLARARVPLALAALAAAVRLPAFLASRHLHFDDGVYGASVVGMRSGMKPFEDLFSPQGPLHLVSLYAGDVVGLRTDVSPRITPVVAGVVAAIAVWLAGSRLGRQGGALIAAVLVATTGTMLWTTAPITGDGIAIACAFVAVAGALAYRDRPSLARAVATGIAMGAGLSVKALVVTAALPVGWWLWSHRRARDLAAAVGAAVAVGVAATAPFGFGPVWEQSVEYHRDSEYLYGPGEQFNKLCSTLVDRDLPLLVAVGLALVFVARRRARLRSDDAVLGAWLLASVLVLVFEPAMFRNHIVIAVAPLALFVARHPPPARVFAAAMVVSGVWWALHMWDLLAPDGYQGAAAELVDELRTLPPDARAISDEPGFVWRAGLRPAPDMNDASIKRINEGQITTAVVARAAGESDVCAVVVWSNRFGDELPGLPEALRDVGYERVREWPRDRALWLKRGCGAGTRG